MDVFLSFFVLNAARVFTVTNRRRTVNVNQATTIIVNNTFAIVAYRFAIEAEVESMALGNRECIRYFHVTGQVDVGGFCFGIVGNLTRTVPSCPGDIITGACVVADVDMCLAADGVAVHRHFRRGGGDHHAEQGTQAQGQGQK